MQVSVLGSFHRFTQRGADRGGGSANPNILGCPVVLDLARVKEFFGGQLMVKQNHFTQQTTTTKRMRIDFQANGEGSLRADGLNTFPCLRQPRRKYPTDLTLYPEDKEHCSQEFWGLMRWAIRIWGQVGICIHEGFHNLTENSGPSGGCIHRGVGNARSLFGWVDTRTKIPISYPL